MKQPKNGNQDRRLPALWKQSTNSAVRVPVPGKHRGPESEPMRGHGWFTTSSRVHGKARGQIPDPRCQLLQIFLNKEGCPITDGLEACLGRPK